MSNRRAPGPGGVSSTTVIPVTARSRSRTSLDPASTAGRALNRGSCRVNSPVGNPGILAGPTTSGQHRRADYPHPHCRHAVVHPTLSPGLRCYGREMRVISFAALLVVYGGCGGTGEVTNGNPDAGGGFADGGGLVTIPNLESIHSHSRRSDHHHRGDHRRPPRSTRRSGTSRMATAKTSPATWLFLIDNFAVGGFAANVFTSSIDNGGRARVRAFIGAIEGFGFADGQDQAALQRPAVRAASRRSQRAFRRAGRRRAQAGHRLSRRRRAAARRTSARSSSTGCPGRRQTTCSSSASPATPPTSRST